MASALTFLAGRRSLGLRRSVLAPPSRAIALAWAAGLLALPLVSRDAYLLRVAAITCVFAILAASWDLLAGYAGQLSFGHALFFGAGAYTSSLASLHLGLAPWADVPLGGVAATALGGAVGLICLRLRGSYLSLATLAFPLIATSVLFAFPEASGGELGVSGVRPLATSRAASYYAVSVPTLALVVGIRRLADSRFGLVLHAIRDDEVAVRASGIDTRRYKVATFSASACAAGISGALYAHLMRGTGPSTLSLALSFQVVIWGVFGGLATVYGPVAAVFILYPLTEWLGGFEGIGELRLLIFALTVLLVLLFMPRGLAPWVRVRIEARLTTPGTPRAASRPP
jgi:branched-chain amino acid transport system permease protein